jgi:hypothetical protein
MRIQQQKEMLERKMYTGWHELKASFTGVNMAAGVLNNSLLKSAAVNNSNDSVLKNTLSYGVTLLATKLITRAAEKMTTLFKKKAPAQ